MSGITIVEIITTEAQQNNSGSFIIIIALIALSLTATYEAFDRFANKRKIEGIAMLSIIVVSILVGLFSSGVFVDNKETETLYIVTIDDSVSAKDFHEIYEIVDKQDDKYTVKLINGKGK